MKRPLVQAGIRTNLLQVKAADSGRRDRGVDPATVGRKQRQGSLSEIRDSQKQQTPNVLGFNLANTWTKITAHIGFAMVMVKNGKTSVFLRGLQLSKRQALRFYLTYNSQCGAHCPL